MKNQTRAYSFIVGAILILFASCKEDTVISANQVPVIDSINTIPILDTHTIYTKTYISDTLNTSANLANLLIVHALGTVNDPFFGHTSAGIYFQVIPPSNQFNFPTEIDSAFIIVPYDVYQTSSWGDTTVPNTQQLTAYRLTENLYKDSVYYSNQQKSYDKGFPISETLNFTANPRDSVFVLGKNRSPHIRLRLKKEVYQDIKQNVPNQPTTADFLNYFKGIYIGPNTSLNSPALPYVHLDGPDNYGRAAVEFFYQEDGTTKSIFFNFIRNECAHYNWIERKYSSQALAYINTPNVSDSIVLLQNEPGAFIDIRMPNIKNLPFGIINSARLVITEAHLAGQSTNSDKYSSPNFLRVYGVDPNNLRYLVSDGIDFNDGSKRTVVVNGLEVSQYILNIPNHIQKAIVGKWDEVHLRIFGAIGRPAAYSLIAGGRGNSMYKTSLNIHYSKPQ